MSILTVKHFLHGFYVRAGKICTALVCLGKAKKMLKLAGGLVRLSRIQMIDHEWIDDNEGTVDPEEEEDLEVIEDDDAGTVSEEILEPFNNPELYEQEAFISTAEIRLMNEGMLNYGDEIILKADVRDVNMSYRLVWEANDNDGHGWFTVGSGDEYRFILDPENAAREYRVEIFAAD